MKSPNSFVRWIVRLILVVALMLVSHARAQTQGNALEDARQKFAAGQYRPAVATISAELSKTRGSAASPQRYDLLMLKGECLLRMDQRTAAADAFAQAQTSAVDPKTASMARSSSLVAKVSPQNKFTPRGGGTPIDILDPDGRKLAFEAMAKERLTTLEPKLDQARRATTLPPMFAVLPPMLEVAGLEFASKGSADESRAILMEIGTRARGLINDELRRLSMRINALEDAANSVTDAGGYVGRRGLFSNEASELKDSVEYLKQIEKTARDVRRQAQQYGFEAQAWEPIVSDSADLADRASAMLNITP